MTRKRTDKRAKQAVPEEILAEGSGPNEVVEADAQALADAAADAKERSSKRGRKSKVQVDAWGQPVEAVVAEADSSEDVADEPAAEPEAVEVTSEEAPVVKKGKRGKKSTARGKDVDATEEDAATESIDASASDESSEANESADSIEASASDESDEDVETTDESEATDTDEPSDEAKSEQSLEDAVMRAEAEAELGAAAVEGEGGGESSEEAEGDVAGAALPTTAGSMDAAQLKNLVEALVFAADKPVTMQRLRQLTRVSEVKRLEQALSEIAADYQHRGIALQHVSGGYQFRTNTTYSVWVQQLIAGRPVRLSRAQLETLAIVAYRQPITRPEVDEIRGVDSSATLRLLLDRSLIRVLGKKEDVGRPVLYGTTKEFLDFFSLQDLRELPTLREYSELTAESRKVMSDRLGIDADGNAVDEDGNPVDDGTDVLPDAQVDSMDASAADPGAEDEAAIEAVSAVTGVLGIEEERIDTSDGPTAEEVEAAAAVEHEAAEQLEAAEAEEEAAEELAASVAELDPSGSDESIEASSSDEHIETSSSDESIAASSSDEHVESPNSDEHVEASSEDTADSDDEVLAAAHDAAHDPDEPQGMPRGASQEDVIGGLDDESSDELHTGEAKLDEAAEASDAAPAGSESALEASAHALDADPSSESLDETDKSPAE